MICPWFGKDISDCGEPNVVSNRPATPDAMLVERQRALSLVSVATV